MGNNYQRLFYILKNMDNDVGYPTGYIKVEINYEAAKIQVSLNNLLDRQGLSYQLFGIKKVDNIISYTVICDVPYVNGRADIKVNADINSIGSNSLRLEEINIFAIITHMPGRATLIKCPLVAYTKGELSWKKELEKTILDKGTIESEKVKQTYSKEKLVEVKKASFPSNTEQVADTIEEIGLFEDLYEEEEGKPEAGLENEAELLETTIDNKAKALEPLKTDEPEVPEVQDIKDEVSEIVKNNEVKIPENVQENNFEIMEAEQENKEQMPEIIQDYETKLSEATNNETKENPEYQDFANQGFDNKHDMPNSKTSIPDVERKAGIESKFESVLTSIYNADKSTTLDRENMAELIQADNDILRFAQENFNDTSSFDIDLDNRKTDLNMPSLKEELDKNFEIYNPFKMKSKSIRWWKINSPGFLNNILFRNNVKSYLLFNPKVMLAHYKYRYIIFGVRNDKHTNKEYLICGVPGVYSIDENPFGSMASWAQLEGYRPKYGAFGYWVILIDPRTGKLLKIK